MIFYHASLGTVTLEDEWLGIGYSGFDAGLNNPALEQDADVGPAPRGKWKIIQWFKGDYEDKGPLVAQLSPVGFDAFGRRGFLIHGDNESLNHTASHGCIILSRDIRQKLMDSGCTDLEVV